MIPFNGIVPMTAEGWDGVPDGPNPFYVAAQDGLYVHKRMLIGRGMAKVEKMPPYPKFGLKEAFIFEADPVPARIMGQIVNFFERIYDKQHTEAAVLLVMHAETKEWRVFVPTQLVSHGGVNYVFDPMHIRYPWLIVGSIHSHCDFGAGHSGTDTGDASDGNDGLHCTIGHIKRDVPQIVAMVATNNHLIHYPESLFDRLFDYSEPKQHEAPAWWDRYVEDTNAKTKPVGFELYARFQKSTVVKTETKITTGQPSKGYKPTGFQSGDWVYSDKAKRMVHKSWTVKDDGTVVIPHALDKNEVIPGIGVSGLRTAVSPRTGMGTRAPQGFTEIRPGVYVPNGSSAILSESAEFNARRAAERGLVWNGDELDLIKSGLKVSDVSAEELALLKELRDNEDPLSWAENLPEGFLDMMEDMNLLTDRDYEWGCLNEEAASQLMEWREILIRKMFNIVFLLREMGETVDVDFGARATGTPLQLALLPDGRGSEDTMGVH